jgi:hypothetical protein
VVDGQREFTGRRATAKDACHESTILRGGEAVDQQAIGTLTRPEIH